MKPHNPYCDGGHCRSEHGEVRVYPLTPRSADGGSNLILCMACFAYENRYRYERGRETGAPELWPQENWNASEVYSGHEWVDALEKEIEEGKS